MVGIGALLLFLAVLLTPTVRGYLGQRSQINQAQAQVEAQEKDIAAKQGQLKQWNDPKYVQEQAKSRLGFVMPGQTLTVTVDKNGQARQSAGTDVIPAKPTQPWYGQLWSSVQGAAASR
ncbi:hypothetical protein AZH51_18520 [Branchiibius sp. NY16-3462-2]|nr:hypothetical protein AZH51_18520 [Branchiibius sp. NY16-3462-2]